MKKKNYIIILILIIIAVGGLFMKHQYDQKEKEIALFEEAQNHMEKFLTTNYKNVKDIHFSEGYYINPMGGISVKGYTNGKKSLKVYMTQAIKKYCHIRLMPNQKKNVKINFVQDKLACSIELG